MRFIKTTLEGAFIIEPEKKVDNRGFFARVFCANEFKDNKLIFSLVQANISKSVKKGTLRGLHFQKHPYMEDRLFRVTRGSVFDVMVDIRPQSPTYMKHSVAKLSDKNYRMIFIPKGFAHGFLTFEDNTEVMYMVSEFYKPDIAGGIRYDDPSLNINWPIEIKVISVDDKSWPDLKFD